MANQPKKYKKFVATAATATLVASAIVPVASAASFSDVSDSNEFAPFIDALTKEGIINGYPTTNTFKPGAALTRGQVVKMLGRWVENNGVEVPADWKTKARFTDVPVNSQDQELVKYAALVADEGVFGGAAGRLMAATNITRQQMAKVLNGAYAAVNGESLIELAEGVDNVRIPDLATARAEYEDAIQALMDLEISSTKSGNFRPLENVTRGQFSKFLFNTINFDASTVSPFEIKAVNNTTVEVIFEDEIENIDKVKFEIDGLKVTNAVVKQTSKRTAVLTTESQKGGTEYTVKVDGEEAGKFVGIAAVVPTAIKITNPSVQGTIGKEATVSAQVTVPEGQSKAGIPVTFNIVTDTNNQLNEKIEVVSYTNEEGVASYSYTRYYEHNDSVTAYATSKSSVFAKGTVYWAEALTLTEVTQGSTIVNGGKKVYKVKASSKYANGFINIAFAENVDVTPDKLVRDVTVTDVGTDSGKYPYQVTTGGTQTVQVKLDKNGEATFTLTGSNATVTPIVFVDGYWDTYNVWKNGNGKLEAQELQAKAPSVKFEISHTLGLTVEPQGQQNAAAITSKGKGGRNYLVTLTDVKTGKVAPDDAAIKVVFPKGSISKDKPVYITVKDTDGKDLAPQRVVEDQVYTTYVDGSKGQVTFKLTGDKDSYAAPTVFVENGVENNKLDAADLQTASETTYFVDAVVNTSKLTVLDGNDDEVTTISSSQPAFFQYKSVDQNGFDYYADNGNYEVTYQVSPQFADVYVSGSGLAATLVKKGTTASVKVWASAGKASLRVVSADTAIASSVTVSASSSQITLEDQPATVNFSKYSASEKTGLATSVDTAKDELTIDGVLYSYAGASYKYQGSTITKSAFEGYIAGNLATVSVTKDDEGKLTFNVISLGTSAQATVDAVNNVLSAGQARIALANYEGFASLPLAVQNAIATEIANDVIGGTIFTVDTLASTYEAEYKIALAKEIGDVVGNGTAAAVVVAQNTTTWTAFVDSIKDIPGSSSVVTKLGNVTVASVQKTIASNVDAFTTKLTGTPTADQKAAEFVAAIDKAITDATASGPVTSALGALTTAKSADATGAGLLAALKATNTVDSTKTNAQVLGLDLTPVTSTLESAFAQKFFDLKPAGDFTALNAKPAFDKAVAHITDVTGPVVKTAEYDKTAKTIKITFDEAVTLSDTLDYVDLSIGGTTPVSKVKATESSSVITIALDTANYGNVLDAGFTGAETITINGFFKADGTAITVKDQSAKTNSYVAAPFNVTIVTP